MEKIEDSVLPTFDNDLLKFFEANFAEPKLWDIDYGQLERAYKYIENGEAEKILLLANSCCGLRIVDDNLRFFKSRGCYEIALLMAYVGTRTNWINWQLKDIAYLFNVADKKKLLASGDFLPDRDTFTLYRGVAGLGPKRRVRGLSWTGNIDTAMWFAERFKNVLHDPAVFQVKVPRKWIMAYSNDRNEDEYIIDVKCFSNRVNPKRITKKMAA